MPAPQPDPIRSALRSYIKDMLLGGGDVSDAENLLLSGLLDSLSVMSLVGFIETQFAIKVPFDDVLIENFETIDAMHAYLTARGVEG